MDVSLLWILLRLGFEGGNVEERANTGWIYPVIVTATSFYLYCTTPPNHQQNTQTRYYNLQVTQCSKVTNSEGAHSAVRHADQPRTLLIESWTSLYLPSVCARNVRKARRDSEITWDLTDEGIYVGPFILIGVICGRRMRA